MGGCNLLKSDTFPGFYLRGAVNNPWYKISICFCWVFIILCRNLIIPSFPLLGLPGNSQIYHYSLVFSCLSWFKGWWKLKTKGFQDLREGLSRRNRKLYTCSLESITKTRALQLQINITLICRLVVLKMWESRLWYHPVTPRSRGYGDVTATYIRRSKIPSRIYAKHQYR